MKKSILMLIVSTIMLLLAIAFTIRWKLGQMFLVMFLFMYHDSLLKGSREQHHKESVEATAKIVDKILRSKTRGE